VGGRWRGRCAYTQGLGGDGRSRVTVPSLFHSPFRHLAPSSRLTLFPPHYVFCAVQSFDMFIHGMCDMQITICVVLPHSF
jgi:hypothetical protein